jgi:hypothetical protein
MSAPEILYLLAFIVVLAIVTLLTKPSVPEAEIRLWECPNCAFGFDALHTQEDGTYSCPVCAEQRLLTAHRQIIHSLNDARQICRLIQAHAVVNHPGFDGETDYEKHAVRVEELLADCVRLLTEDES